ncbi:endonuclease III domain-containing protein [Longitalea luteola]|uniref:endonuclease III domain-containing protein n=1 Tax=Longitalea luteola TaxID=2812563 RepID=UPI001A95F3FD|nr:endonuclease III [Longitalea luteola]
MKRSATDWPASLKPLLKKYKRSQHPLEAKNAYQWMVMVVLSAQSSDDLINHLAPEFFKKFPDMRALAKADPKSLFPYISKVRNFAHKAQWLVETAKKLKDTNQIPLEMEALVEFPGIGRKSANVIRRGAGLPPDGIIVDLHTIRVANRLGVVDTTNAEKIEKQLMETLPKNEWDAGMAMSFLGREICRPEPECPICLMKRVCAYYNTVIKKKVNRSSPKR